MRLDIFRNSCFESIFIPDSAVAIDKKREAQPFRSEVDGFLPLSRHRSAVHRGMSSLIATTRAKAQNDFETSQSDAFAAPGFHLASGNCGIRVYSPQLAAGTVERVSGRAEHLL